MFCGVVKGICGTVKLHNEFVSFICVMYLIFCSYVICFFVCCHLCFTSCPFALCLYKLEALKLR